jgi:hypothetical protein
MELLSVLEAYAVYYKVVVQVLMISMTCDEHFVFVAP